MELLVVTLAHTTPGRDVEGLTRVRLISDTIRNAPGFVHARFYRSREPDAYYFLLTTWEDEESWKKAQDRYSPKDLLLGSDSKLLAAPPEQWLMQYLWGYSRPSSQANIAAAHLANVRPDTADRIERGWIEGLRRQAAEPTLAFAFLARGRNEDSTGLPVHTAPNATPTNHMDDHKGTSLHIPGATFLNLLSWPGEMQRQEFYINQNYKAISSLLNSMGVVRVLALDPL